LYKGTAYDSTRYSIQQTPKGPELAKTIFQEEAHALGGESPENEVRKSESKGYLKMQLPKWFCTTICGGLNLDDLLDGEETIETPEDTSDLGVEIPKSHFNSKVSDPEERDVLNKGRYNADDEFTPGQPHHQEMTNTKTS